MIAFKAEHDFLSEEDDQQTEFERLFEEVVDAGIELTHQHIIADSPNKSGIVYSGIL